MRLLHIAIRELSIKKVEQRELFDQNLKAIYETALFAL